MQNFWKTAGITLLMGLSTLGFGNMAYPQSAGKTLLRPGIYLSDDGRMCDVEISSSSTETVLVTRALGSSGGIRSARGCQLRPAVYWYRSGASRVYVYEGSNSFPASMTIESNQRFIHNSPLGTHSFTARTGSHL